VDYRFEAIIVACLGTKVKGRLTLSAYPNGTPRFNISLTFVANKEAILAGLTPYEALSTAQNGITN
jgi:hypothetical protein